MALYFPTVFAAPRAAILFGMANLARANTPVAG
jgi:hypothetical protein